MSGHTGRRSRLWNVYMVRRGAGETIRHYIVVRPTAEYAGGRGGERNGGRADIILNSVPDLARHVRAKLVASIRNLISATAATTAVRAVFKTRGRVRVVNLPACARSRLTSNFIKLNN